MERTFSCTKRAIIIQVNRRISNSFSCSAVYKLFTQFNALNIQSISCNNTAVYRSFSSSSCTTTSCTSEGCTASSQSSGVSAIRQRQVAAVEYASISGSFSRGNSAAVNQRGSRTVSKQRTIAISLHGHACNFINNFVSLQASLSSANLVNDRLLSSAVGHYTSNVSAKGRFNSIRAYNNAICSAIAHGCCIKLSLEAGADRRCCARYDANGDTARAHIYNILVTINSISIICLDAGFASFQIGFIAEAACSTGNLIRQLAFLIDCEFAARYAHAAIAAFNSNGVTCTVLHTIFQHNVINRQFISFNFATRNGCGFTTLRKFCLTLSNLCLVCIVFTKFSYAFYVKCTSSGNASSIKRINATDNSFSRCQSSAVKIVRTVNLKRFTCYIAVIINIEVSAAQCQRVAANSNGSCTGANSQTARSISCNSNAVNSFHAGNRASLVNSNASNANGAISIIAGDRRTINRQIINNSLFCLQAIAVEQIVIINLQDRTLNCACCCQVIDVAYIISCKLYACDITGGCIDIFSSNIAAICCEASAIGNFFTLNSACIHACTSTVSNFLTCNIARCRHISAAYVAVSRQSYAVKGSSANRCTVKAICSNRRTINRCTCNCTSNL